MVLAAGLGRRMRPLTELVAKPALPVLNRPLLAWTLERLQRAGATEVVINTHHRPGTVRRAAAQARRPHPRLRYSHEARILGTGGGPRKVRERFRGEPFVREAGVAARPNKILQSPRSEAFRMMRPTGVLTVNVGVIGVFSRKGRRSLRATPVPSRPSSWSMPTMPRWGDGRKKTGA